MTLIIRSATTKDIPELMRLAEQWLNPLWYKDIKKVWLHNTLHVLDSLGVLIRRRSHFVVVAELEHKLVGFVDFLCWMDWLVKSTKLMVQHIYVDEAYRRQEIGTKLLNRIIRDYSPDYIFVDTKPDRFPHAEKLYKKVGLIHNSKRKWMERYE